MKVLITGSGGFVGNFLAKYFSEKGIPVVGIDIERQPFQNYPNFTFYNCDIRDETEIADIVQREKPTHIIHLAWLMKPQHDPDYEHSVDVGGSENIIAAAALCESVRQFIFFSSTSVYGGWKDNPGWITETQERRPGPWVYAQYKCLVEDLLRSFTEEKDMKVVILRMCTACGSSYFRRDGLVDLMAGSSAGILVNGKDIKMQFVHEDDVASAVDLIVHNSEIEGIYNLAPDSFAFTRLLKCRKKIFIPVPKFFFKTVLTALWKLKKTEFSPTSTNLTSYSLVASSKKLRDELNFKFKYSTEEAFFEDAEKRGY